MKLISPIERRRMLLLKAADSCGSQAVFAEKIGMDRAQYNRCLNGIEDLPLHHAINIQAVTNGAVRTKELMAAKYKASPGYKKAVDIIELWSSKAENCADYLIPLNSIQAVESISIKPTDISNYYLYRPIILDDINDNSFKLVGGFRSFYFQKSIDRRKIPAKVLDFKKILKTNPDNLKEIMNKNSFLISEKIEIGQYIQGLVGDRQGRRTDLKIKLQLRENFPEVNLNGRTREFIANALDFGNDRTYQQAKKIITHGSNLLVETIDRQIISISKAASMIKLSQHEQQEIIEQRITKKKLKVDAEFLTHWRLSCQ